MLGEIMVSILTIDFIFYFCCFCKIVCFYMKSYLGKTLTV